MTRAMRGLLALLLVAVGLVAAGCSGADGQRAQELLTQAQAAEQNVKSASFDLEVNANLDGQQVAMTMRGGGYTKGRRAGDMFLQASASGAMPAFDFSFMKVGERAYMNMNGDRREMPFPASLQTQIPSQNFGSAAFLELARYVKKVKVAAGGIVDGDPTTTISGTVDTAGLVKALAKLNGVTQLAGESAPDVSAFADYLGDTHATIVISDRTHLVTGAVIDLSIDAYGKQIQLQLLYRLRDVNTTVRFPDFS
jgi:hypothetical protein